MGQAQRSTQTVLKALDMAIGLRGAHHANWCCTRTRIHTAIGGHTPVEYELITAVPFVEAA
ncbi:Uncharacterised protein [Actinobaculum suis]|uniref:Uncharacterized protein n=1 Tax=Actinobaculum suis TaxID=1657 RepID=A0A7Z9C8B4_9ACTO|nr:Uncharacterised protein [Actinobaculum suis]